MPRIDALSLLAEGLNFDFATKGIDEPLTTEELNGMTGLIGLRDGVLKRSGKTNPSARDFIAYSGRGHVESATVGGPKEIADAMEEIFTARGCDGFVVAATYVPGGYAAARKSRPAAAAGRGMEAAGVTGGGGVKSSRELEYQNTCALSLSHCVMIPPLDLVPAL